MKIPLSNGATRSDDLRRHVNGVLQSALLAAFVLIGAFIFQRTLCCHPVVRLCWLLAKSPRKTCSRHAACNMRARCSRRPNAKPLWLTHAQYTIHRTPVLPANSCNWPATSSTISRTYATMISPAWNKRAGHRGHHRSRTGSSVTRALLTLEDENAWRSIDAQVIRLLQRVMAGEVRDDNVETIRLNLPT